MENETSVQRMAKSVDFFKADLAKLRTGRAHSGLLEQIKIICYGQEMPLSQAASITVTGQRQLMVTPWDKANEEAIEKAIRESDLGLNPASDSGRVRVDLPELSEERRAELVKIVKRDAEAMRVAVRNIRRERIQEMKSLVKEKEMSKDEQQRAEAQLQKETDDAISAIDQLAADKASELMGN